MTLAYLALCILLIFVPKPTAIAHALICCPVAPRDDASQGGITKSTIVDMIIAVVLFVVVIVTFMWLDWVCRAIHRMVSLERRLRLEIRNLLTLVCGVTTNVSSTPGGVGRPASHNSDATGPSIDERAQASCLNFRSSAPSVNSDASLLEHSLYENDRIDSPSMSGPSA